MGWIAWMQPDHTSQCVFLLISFFFFLIGECGFGCVIVGANRKKHMVLFIFIFFRTTVWKTKPSCIVSNSNSATRRGQSSFHHRMISCGTKIFKVYYWSSFRAELFFSGIPSVFFMLEKCTLFEVMSLRSITSLDFFFCFRRSYPINP